MTGSWRYTQRSGLYEHLQGDGLIRPIFRGYSGHGIGLDDRQWDEIDGAAEDFNLLRSRRVLDLLIDGSGGRR